ncbi:MAG: hypothetical protein GY789_09825 [Hyphomicrobiales bacterium]|nr:hypothetical protein [Hyphomicrobiales bacterium]
MSRFQQKIKTASAVLFGLIAAAAVYVWCGDMVVRRQEDQRRKFEAQKIAAFFGLHTKPLR